MAINFRVIERGEPGVTGGGDKKFYALAAGSGEVSLDDLTHIIEKISTVSGADIRAVLYAMVDAMIMNLEQGKIVRLGDLGSLRVSLSSEGRENADDVTSAAIKGAKTVFVPGRNLKDMLKTLKYKKLDE